MDIREVLRRLIVDLEDIEKEIHFIDSFEKKIIKEIENEIHRYDRLLKFVNDVEALVKYLATHTTIDFRVYQEMIRSINQSKNNIYIIKNELESIKELLKKAEGRNKALLWFVEFLRKILKKGK